MTTIPHEHAPVIQEAIEWALQHGFALKTGPGVATHCAFSLAPTLIDRKRFDELKSAAPLLGKLIHGVSEDYDFLQQAMAPIASGDAFFGQLVDLHKEIHSQPVKRVPLLFMRSDFMDDSELGPRIIEFNGIAAGMGPFGQRAHQLHRFLQENFPAVFNQWAPSDSVALVNNPAIAQLSFAVAKAAFQVQREFNDSEKPLFLMVVQEGEDNVYDQHLLEEGLRNAGVRTLRRTFRQLHEQLSSGENGRLLLRDHGGVDAIYLRAGYQYCDYLANDLIEQACCETLIQTRAFMERHRVAINATVGQQLATCKRVQMLLTTMPAAELTRFGLAIDEAELVKTYLGEMIPVNAESAEWFRSQDSGLWVLKNQGEGGGHCVFDQDIQPRLEQLQPEEYSAWSLMRRLRPAARPRSALLVRKGDAMVVDDLISELGIFTVHIDGQAATDDNGYAGYLIRSKPSTVAEGGVHSGMGAADSLATLLP
ncbi:glutathione synthase [Parendozoicomonas haliclonae]|uniref:glutathione synthase n=2 Tax=Parendozoicomonas haliclonae TaxID=1960125 RepID=A0A1X7AR27_9GAMM|nr:glutathione synthase [Parendozoicomonas haliclonae]SMA50695.1 Eukaryotic glutathione synthase, ATP binding domain [Parendozoicomonas haliclonae]